MEKNAKFSKWVACWGNATSISDREISTYSKDLTLRYPVKMCFNGNKLRFHFSNFTGTDPIVISSAFVAIQTSESFSEYKPVEILFNGEKSKKIEPGKEVVSDETLIDVKKGETIEVSMYFGEFTQMNSGTLVTGPLSKGKFAYGNFACERELPINLTRNTNWFYFLNTVDIYTEEKNYALICYGDSITAQSWPDYLSIRINEEGFNNVSIIRRAVCGTRILREYDCITYAAYGLKGETRFPVETEVSGAKAVIVQHGINDIIHPVGVEVNQFRPWSDMPKPEDLINAFKDIYIKTARNKGLKIWGGTLLPIFGWRTYELFRDEVRNKYNEWLRNSCELDGIVDFDKAVRNPEKPEKFKDGYDSGDHLHPSEIAYKAMAAEVPEELFNL